MPFIIKIILNRSTNTAAFVSQEHRTEGKWGGNKNRSVQIHF